MNSSRIKLFRQVGPILLIMIAIIVPIIIHIVRQRNQNVLSSIAPDFIITSTTTTTTTTSVVTTTSTTSTTITTSSTTSSSTTTIREESLYTSGLNENSSRCCCETCYTLALDSPYELIQMNVSMTGSYDLYLNSSFSSNIYVFNNSYNPASWTSNLLTTVDQFMPNVSLDRELSYWLVIMACKTIVIASFSVSAIGPGMVNFVRTPTPELCTIDQSIYVSALMNHSSMFCLTALTCTTPNDYYQATEIAVVIRGVYVIKGNGSMQIYGFLYRNSYNPTLWTVNLQTEDFGSEGVNTFRMNALLETNVRYVLIVTTLQVKAIGTFSINSIGPGPLNFTRLDTPATSLILESYYSSAITEFSAQACFYSLCSQHYEAIRFTIDTNGSYIMSSECAIDNYGFMYSPTYFPSNWTENLLYSSEPNSQFMINAFLQTGVNYTLVVIPGNPQETGNFTIIVDGRALADFN